MSDSPSEHSSNSSVLSDSTQASSLHNSLVEGRASPVFELVELNSKEIQALKQYSHSVQNFTYQLFQNFRLELQAKGRPSPSVKINDPSNLSKSKSVSSQEDHLGFLSTNLMIDSAESSPPFVNPPNAQSNKHNGRRKLSDLPRRKKRPGPDFPEDTGL